MQSIHVNTEVKKSGCCVFKMFKQKKEEERTLLCLIRDQLNVLETPSSDWEGQRSSLCRIGLFLLKLKDLRRKKLCLVFWDKSEKGCN